MDAPKTGTKKSGRGWNPVSCICRKSEGGKRRAQSENWKGHRLHETGSFFKTLCKDSALLLIGQTFGKGNRCPRHGPETNERPASTAKHDI